MTVKILHVVGARPNFMKLAPVTRSLSLHPHVKQYIVHTGQHYDKNMSDVFFQELGLPEPDINLGVGSGSHTYQTAQIMSHIEPVLMNFQPHWVFVYGDVNSTLAASLVASKLNIRIVHVEAGARSFDRTMPEEINRLITDCIADVLFTTSVDGDRNLAREGIALDKIHFVGNVMIDTLVYLLPKIDERDILRTLGLSVNEPYLLITLHRPTNVDDDHFLQQISEALGNISQHTRIIFPVHPRTRKRISELSLTSVFGASQLVEPVSYLDFLHLQKNATAVVTDSGGVQEETTYLGVPCLTMRTNTERPITVEIGTNLLIGHDTERLRKEILQILDGKSKRGQIPPLWDGRAANRITEIMLKIST